MKMQHLPKSSMENCNKWVQNCNNNGCKSVEGNTEDVNDNIIDISMVWYTDISHYNIYSNRNTRISAKSPQICVVFYSKRWNKCNQLLLNGYCLNKSGANYGKLSWSGSWIFSILTFVAFLFVGLKPEFNYS
jgi:hypothetical protein